MRQFYTVFNNEKVSPFATQLAWSHYVELLPIKDDNKLLYYLNISVKQKLSRNDFYNEYINYRHKQKKSNGGNEMSCKIAGTTQIGKEVFIMISYEAQKIRLDGVVNTCRLGGYTVSNGKK